MKLSDNAKITKSKFSLHIHFKGPYVYCDFRCDYLLLMDVNDWMCCECSDEDTPYGVHILRSQNIHYSSTRSHPSEKEYRIFRNRTENCKCVNEP